MNASRITLATPEETALSDLAGVVALCIESAEELGPLAKSLDTTMNGTITRFLSRAPHAAEKLTEFEICFPEGLKADKLIVAILEDEPRLLGAKLADISAGRPLSIIVDGPKNICPEIALGAALKGYDFSRYRSAARDIPSSIQVISSGLSNDDESFVRTHALMDGVFLARDLVNEPANILTPNAYANRIEEIEIDGLQIETIHEAELEALGMDCLLAVAKGSSEGAKVVVMNYRGAGQNSDPVALIGKGVVFDAGGLSIKGAAGMEEMKMDMSGSATVAGTILALAASKAKVNVTGVLGLVENMPSGSAMRPGDIVRSMKGDTVEIIDTDAEGRLVLADLLWYAQDKLGAKTLIDIATLTNAVMIALGRHRGGLFCNDEALAVEIESTCEEAGEPVWRLPLDPEYDVHLKSLLADVKHVGGRQGAAIIAARFLQRFVRPQSAWAHLDISGVNFQSYATALAPAGATGWGVLSLESFIRRWASAEG